MSIGVPDLLARKGLADAQRLLKSRLDRAQNELATGLKEDRFAATGGDTARLASVERSIAALDARQTLAGLARARADAQQTVLAMGQETAQELGFRLIDDIRAGTLSSAVLTAQAATDALGQVMAALNQSVGGRTLFGGAEAVARPLADAGRLIDLVQAALNAYADPAEGLQAVDDFFDPPELAVPPGINTFPGPERFVGDVYLGPELDAPGVELAEGERMAFAVRADDPALRQLLKGLAIAAAGVRGDYLGDPAARTQVFEAAGQTLMLADERMGALRANLGAAQARIEQAETRMQAERTTFGLAFNGIIRRDEFEAASQVAELETRLQALYAITARAAQLSFVNFLR